MTFKVTQGHRYWCHSIGHMRFPTSLIAGVMGRHKLSPTSNFTTRRTSFENTRDLSATITFVRFIGRGIFSGRQFAVALAGCYTYGDSDVISVSAGVRRHLVGKTLGNVFTVISPKYALLVS